MFKVNAKSKEQVVVGHVVEVWRNEERSSSTQTTLSTNSRSSSGCTIHIEIKNAKGSLLLIQIRALPPTYIIRRGDRLSLRFPNLIPLYQLPNIPDEILSNTSARYGGIVHFKYPTSCVPVDIGSRSNGPGPCLTFENLTKYNTPVPDSVIELYYDLRSDVRRQVTWSILAERIELWPEGEHLVYLSAVLMEIALVKLWKDGKLYCITCDRCGGVVFANTLVGLCETCERGLELRINPAAIGQVSDETAGLHTGEEGHAMLVADGVRMKLLGLERGIGMGEAVTESWLREKEEKLQYARHTWVLMWMGRWEGGRLVCVDILDWKGLPW